MAISIHFGYRGDDMGAPLYVAVQHSVTRSPRTPELLDVDRNRKQFSSDTRSLWLILPNSEVMATGIVPMTSIIAAMARIVNIFFGFQTTMESFRLRLG